mmetsp:Transcript_11421/g.37528  ORF Transcript_11421/g.37528 Transcript_11421/m.37528 type:complete len:296 (+) Transcript_11421:10-897(+)
MMFFSVFLLLSLVKAAAWSLPVFDVESPDLVALREVGAAVVLNHGLDLSLILSTTRGAFNRTGFRSTFVPRGGESGGDVEEAKESFVVSKGELLDAFHEDDGRVLEKTYADLAALARRIVDAIPPLRGCCDKDADDTAVGRLVHYFCPVSPETTDVVGSAPHTDWGLLTFVVADRPGLELFHGGSWRRPPLDSPTLILHAGDYMAMTVPGVTSPRHRVVLRTTKTRPSLVGGGDRYSLVFFYYPDSDAPVPEDLSRLGKDLSVLQCQAADTRSCEPLPSTFGALVANKWREVSRR